MYMTLKGEGSTASWEVSEAALFVMTAVAKDIDPCVPLLTLLFVVWHDNYLWLV